MKLKSVLIPVLALSLFGASAAFAADTPKKLLGKAGGPLLTKEQLRACMTQKAGFAPLDDALAKEQAAIGGVKSELASSGDALKARLETLDRTSADAVAAYNDDMRARDKRIDEYQARATAFNARVEAMQAEREAYAKSCENRRYFEDDEIAIKKGK